MMLLASSHTRENCAEKKWISVARQHRLLRQLLQQWVTARERVQGVEQHAQATHTASMWRDMRAAAKAASSRGSGEERGAGGGSAVSTPRWSRDKLSR